MEEWVVQSPSLQRFVLRRHERAFRRLTAGLPCPGRVGIVGGGLFPRTALIAGCLWPSARLTVIDSNSRNLARARPFLTRAVELAHRPYDRGQDNGFDLLVVPLAFSGNRRLFYQNPPAPRVFVHDWIWNKRGKSVVVSLLLLKRLNLVQA